MTPQAIIAETRMTPRQWVAVIVAVLLNTLDGIDVLAVAFAAPGLVKDWALAPTEIGIIISAGLVGMSIGSLAIAPIADIIGRRPAVIGALSAMALGMLLCAVAKNPVQLALFRLLTGMGIGVMLAATNAITAEFANDKWRTLAISLMLMGYPLGGALGGALAAMLLQSHGWEAVFWMGGIASIAMLPPVLFALPESIDYVAARGGPSALERANRLLRGLGQREAETLPPPVPVVRVPTAAILSPGLIRRSLTLAIAYALHVMTLYYVISWLPMVVTKMGFSAAEGASVAVWGNVGGLAAGLIFGLLSVRIPTKPLLIFAMLTGGAATALFGQLPADLGLLKIGAFAAVFFVDAAMLGLYTLMALSFPSTLRVTGTGFAIGCGRGGSVASPLIAGFLIQAGLGYPAVTAMLALGTMVGAIVIATLPTGSARLVDAPGA